MTAIALSMNVSNAAPVRKITETGNAFLHELLPGIHEVNRKIARERKIAGIQIRAFRKRGTLGPNAWHILRTLGNKYGVDTSVPESENSKNELKKRMDILLRRVDIIPHEIVAAQAIIESGWGKSNAAKRTNNYFGITTRSKDMGYKVTQSGSTIYYLKSYGSMQECIEDYAMLLNTHPAYNEFRNLRQKARTQMRKPQAVELLPGLIRWSERRESYLAKLRLVIHHYLPLHQPKTQPDPVLVVQLGKTST